MLTAEAFRDLSDAEACDYISSGMSFAQVHEEVVWNLARARSFLSSPPQVILEIGCGHGGNLCILSRLFEGSGLIIGISLGDIHSDFIETTVSPAELLHLQMDSQLSETFDQLVAALAGRKIDMLFIDGDHHYACVKHDFEEYLPLVNDPGIVVIHDIMHEPGMFWVDIEDQYAEDRAFACEETVADCADPPGRGVLYFSSEGVTLEPSTEAQVEVAAKVETPIEVIAEVETQVEVTAEVETTAEVTAEVESLPKVFLPFMGEFGSKLYKHCSAVAAVPPPKIICHERGEEPIYPGATERFIFERPDEDGRGAAGHAIQGEIYAEARDHFGDGYEYVDPLSIVNSGPRKFFVPQHTGEYDVNLDIVLLTRRKNYAGGRNWMAWPAFADLLASNGYKLFLGGRADSSFVMDYPAAWDWDNPLDATIWAIKKAALVIGTSTGTQALALLCGAHTWVIVHDKGYDSGPSRTGLEYGFYESSDHSEAGWRLVPHWYDYEWIVMEVNDYMRRYREGSLTVNSRGGIVRNSEVNPDAA